LFRSGLGPQGKLFVREVIVIRHRTELPRPHREFKPLATSRVIPLPSSIRQGALSSAAMRQ
jgi:hypothetical protein